MKLKFSLTNSREKWIWISSSIYYVRRSSMKKKTAITCETSHRTKQSYSPFFTILNGFYLDEIGHSLWIDRDSQVNFFGYSFQGEENEMEAVSHYYKTKNK